MAHMRLFADQPDQRGGVLFEAERNTPEQTLECLTGRRTTEFSEAALQISCVADVESSLGLPLCVRMRVGFGYRGGEITFLDYRESPGSLTLTRLPPPGQIGIDITEARYRTYSRSIVLPMAGAKMMLLSPDERIEVYLERRVDPDSYLGKMQVWVTGTLGSGIEIVPWRVRHRRSELMVTHSSPKILSTMPGGQKIPVAV